MKFTEKHFPLYLMRENDKRFFLPFSRAAALFNSWFSKADIVGTVLEEDFTLRDITNAERKALMNLADEIDASK